MMGRIFVLLFGRLPRRCSSLRLLFGSIPDNACVRGFGGGLKRVRIRLKPLKLLIIYWFMDFLASLYLFWMFVRPSSHSLPG